MPPRSRSVVVILGALASVILVVAGSTVAAGWSGKGDALAAGSLTNAPPAPVATAAAGDSAAEATPEPATSVPAPPDAARDPATRGRAGTVVARGSELVVERVDLGAVTTVEVRSAEREVSTVYRVTVSAGPYVMRAMPAVLSVDGTPLGVAAESDDLSSLVLYTFDDAVTTQGATLSLAYGLSPDAPAQWSATLGAAS